MLTRAGISDCNPGILNPRHLCQSWIPELVASQSCNFGVTKILLR